MEQVLPAEHGRCDFGASYATKYTCVGHNIRPFILNRSTAFVRLSPLISQWIEPSLCSLMCRMSASALSRVITNSPLLRHGLSFAFATIPPGLKLCGILYGKEPMNARAATVCPNPFQNLVATICPFRCHLVFGFPCRSVRMPFFNFLGYLIIRSIRVIRVQKQESRHPSALLHLTSYIPSFYPSSSPLGGLLLPPPWLSPPSVMSSSPDAAAAACGSTFCQLTSSENWRLNLAATVQPSRLLPLAALSISAVATFRVPRPSGDGYNAGGYIALWLTPQSRLSG